MKSWYNYVAFVSFCALSAFTVLLLTVCLTHAATTNSISGSFTVSSSSLNEVTYGVITMNNSVPQSVNTITGCTVTGNGPTFNGLSSSVSTTIPLFNLTMSTATVTSATIFRKGYFPPNSNYTHSYTTANMWGNTPIVIFKTLVSAKYVVIYVYETTATWNAENTGGSIVLVSGTLKRPIQRHSRLCAVHTYAKRAQHILHPQDSPCSATLDWMVMNRGLLAANKATCVDCTAENIWSEYATDFITATNYGVVCFSNFTSTESKLFRGAAASLKISSGANLLIYGTLMEGSVLKYDTGVTLGGMFMSPVIKLTANNVITNYLLDVYTMITGISSNTSAIHLVGSPSSAFCALPSWSSIWWKRTQCHCASRTHRAYCMPISGSALHYVNYNDTKHTCDKSVMCTGALVGIVVAPICFVLVVLIVELVICYSLRKKRQADDACPCSDTTSEICTAYELGYRIGSMCSRKNSQGPMSFHSSYLLNVLSRNSSHRQMSFRNDDPAHVSIWTKSQALTLRHNEEPFQHCGVMQMPQVVPRGSVMWQASSGEGNASQFSSDQMQYFDIERNEGLGENGYAIE
ncbi:hypothetical protein STCU_11958 [Strigomonas culicis]|uniref:Membrane-associated protein n=1 Tax=Strigomonas culicis TaxID=28005 RepID=S9TGP8_9TRYP|nr:hypothetical protein STCU_11958 [Strigomonas culicis]|eukprot:EPY15518.1 hypothetical protein STCU_11958 [Strigomonas culicis]